MRGDIYWLRYFCILYLSFFYIKVIFKFIVIFEVIYKVKLIKKYFKVGGNGIKIFIM